MNLKKNHYSRRALALLLTLVMCVGMIPTAFAAQQNSYHDPAEHWMQASGRTNELDANSVVTRETFKCGECGKATSFEVFRVPEYTRNGQPALSRNVKYSDGTMVDGVGKGDTMDGIPGKDATYTGYHYTKAVCETCGGINTNMSKSEYGYLKNVYWLYDCAAAFTQELDETVSYEYTDDTYHTATTKGGTYCAFCYGTNHTVSRKLERHSMVTEVLPQPANGRFATVEKCSLCDYARYDYTAAKAVIADYYGVVDGKPHTITVSDLSEAGVRTSIRYGNSADSCTMTSAPNYTEAGQYMVYYEITYTYKGKEMTENGVAKVWLRDESTKDDGSCACGCGDPNCGCQNKNCNGNCCTDKGCGENHKYILLDSTKAGCTTLGYDRYLCTKCGKIEKRDYVDSLGHAWQSIVIRDATCETDGKLLELCSRCGQMKQTATPKGEHSYEVYTVAATCTSPGYTVRECSVCGDRHIEDITAALPHNYESHVIAATCENGGKTIHRCDGCGSSFVTDYTDALGHSWDEGTLVTNATCTGKGVMEYRAFYQKICAGAAAHIKKRIGKEMKNVKGPITEINQDSFWDLIHEAKNACGQDMDAMLAYLKDRLVSMGPTQAQNFHDIIHVYEDLADKFGLWDAAGIMKEYGCSDDGFIDFRAWLIAQGREVYFAALADPDSLADVVPYGDCRFEQLSYVGDYASGGRTQAEKNKSTARKYSSMGENAPPPFDGDAKDQRSWTRWAAEWLYEARKVCKSGAPVCMFIDWRQLPAATDALQWAGWIWRGTAVWDKGNSRPQKGRFRQQAEYIVWGSNGDMPISRPVPCLPGVFKYGNPQSRIHLTEKPLQLMRDIVKITEPGGHILDPFAGSGTTVLAAVQEGYTATGIEVTDTYAELARERIRKELACAA